MKLLRAYVPTDSAVPVLSALREAGGRPLVLPPGEFTNSEYESLLLALVSDPRRAVPVVKIQAICADGDADRSIDAVTTAAQSVSKEPSIVLITSWSGKKNTESSHSSEAGSLARTERQEQ